MNIVHIGGRGSAGPAGHLFHLKDIQLHVIEADLSGSGWGSYEQKLTDHSEKHGFPVYLVSACISSSEQEATFFLNHDPRSSSLLPPATTALDYCRWTSTRVLKIFPWSEVTRPVREIPLRTTTLDRLWKEEIIPLPAVLSMDIQGSEYDALLGAEQMFAEGKILAVITEVEFRPMYEGQGLFGDITNLLLDRGFFFSEFLKMEIWWEGMISGKGFPAVAEVLYMKDHKLIDDHDDLIQLAAIAYSFGHDSYGYILSSKALAINRGRFNDHKGNIANYVCRYHIDRMPLEVNSFNKIVAVGRTYEAGH